MEFFNSAIEVLQTLVVALGAGLGVWGAINLLEGYGNDNPGSKSQGMKQLMAGGGVALIGITLIPLLSGLFGSSFPGGVCRPVHIYLQVFPAPPWQTDSYHKRKRIANRIFTFILKGRCYYADSDSPYFSAQPAQDPYQPFFLIGGGAEWKQFSKRFLIGSSRC